MKELSADELSIKTGSKPKVNGLRASGNNLQIADGLAQLNIKDLQLADHPAFFLKILLILKKMKAIHKGQYSQLEFVPDINAIIEGKIITGDIRIIKPDIQIHLRRNR